MKQRVSAEQLQSFVDSPTTHIPSTSGLVLDLRDCREQLAEAHAEVERLNQLLNAKGGE